MELYMRCHACGYGAVAEESDELMLKVRLWNHVSKVHPTLANRFRDVVDLYEDVADAAPAHKHIHAGA